MFSVGAIYIIERIIHELTSPSVATYSSEFVHIRDSRIFFLLFSRIQHSQCQIILQFVINWLPHSFKSSILNGHGIIVISVRNVGKDVATIFAFSFKKFSAPSMPSNASRIFSESFSAAWHLAEHHSPHSFFKCVHFSYQTGIGWRFPMK